MGIIVDIVVVTILLLNIVIGYKKGLVNVIFNIFAFLIAIIITLITCIKGKTSQRLCVQAIEAC